MRRYAAAVDLLGSECTDQRRVLKGIVGGILFEGHRAYWYIVFFLARQRAHHHELIAAERVVVLWLLHFPLQFHSTCIGQHLVVAELKHRGSEVLGLVQYGIVIVLTGHRHRSYLQLGLDGHAFVLLGGRHGDEAGVGILIEGDAVEGLARIAHIDIFDGLVAREWNL